jgi:hypothetical protein
MGTKGLSDTKTNWPTDSRSQNQPQPHWSVKGKDPDFINSQTGFYHTGFVLYVCRKPLFEAVRYQEPPERTAPVGGSECIQQGTAMSLLMAHYHSLRAPVIIPVAGFRAGV